MVIIMKYALVCPLIKIETGFLISDVSENIFEVALPLFWVECDDFVVSQEYWYNPETKEILQIPLPEPIIELNNVQSLSEGTQTL